MVTEAESRPSSPGWYRYPPTPAAMLYWDGTKFTQEFIPDSPSSPATAPPASNGTPEAHNSAEPSPAASPQRADGVAPDGSSGLQPAAPADTSSPISEGSLIGRVVAVLTPLLAVAAGWLAGVVANTVPGVNLDTGQITAFMIATLTAVLAAGYKWLHGWQAHERRVAAGEETPRKIAGPPRG